MPGSPPRISSGGAWCERTGSAAAVLAELVSSGESGAGPVRGRLPPRRARRSVPPASPASAGAPGASPAGAACDAAASSGCRRAGPGPRRLGRRWPWRRASAAASPMWSSSTRPRSPTSTRRSSAPATADSCTRSGAAPRRRFASAVLDEQLGLRVQLAAAYRGLRGRPALWGGAARRPPRRRPLPPQPRAGRPLPARARRPRAQRRQAVPPARARSGSYPRR